MKINLPVTQTNTPFPKGKILVSKTDLKGVITYASDTFVEISGFARAELIGKRNNLVRLWTCTTEELAKTADVLYKMVKHFRVVKS